VHVRERRRGEGGKEGVWNIFRGGGGE